MFEEEADLDDRIAGWTVGGGILLLLGICIAAHLAGFRFAGGASGSFSL